MAAKAQQSPEDAIETATAGAAPSIVPVVAPVLTAAQQAAARVAPAVQTAVHIERQLQAEAGRTTVRQRTAVQRALTFRNGAIAALAGFATVGYLVRRLRPLSWDVDITLGLQRVRAPGFRALMRAVSALGFAPQSQIIVGSVAALLWLSGLRLEALFTCSTWGAGTLSSLIKLAVRRPRPAAPLVRVTKVVRETSFPSGHTVHYTTFYGFLLFLAFTLLKPVRLRRSAMALCGSLVALVGPSRIYQGHHWASDVLAAYFLGVSWLLAMTETYRRFQARPAEALPAWLRPRVRRQPAKRALVEP